MAEELSLAQIADRLDVIADERSRPGQRFKLLGLADRVRRHAEQAATVDEVLAEMHIYTDEPMVAARFAYESWMADVAERDLALDRIIAALTIHRRSKTVSAISRSGDFGATWTPIGRTCLECGIEWPCPTAKALGVTE